MQQYSTLIMIQFLLDSEQCIASKLYKMRYYLSHTMQMQPNSILNECINP